MERKRLSLKHVCIFNMLMIMTVISYGQGKISGTVTDQNGNNAPLIGVNVVIKGTTIGTITDINGKYSLNANSPEDILTFSFIGYENQEVKIGSQSEINISLAEASEQLDEIIVVGYSVKKKGELTGSISTVNAKEIETTASTNLTKSLAGRVSGLIVNDRGGYPGADGNNAVTLLIRGTSTLGNNAPLIVVDGVPTNSFAFLAPSDIESFTVLKDAAAAIYGAQAANGVILVTTKRGKSGKARVNFSTINTFSNFTRVPEMMNSAQYATYQNEIDTRYGNPLKFSEEDIRNFAAGNDPINYPNTDWYDLTMKDMAFETRNSLSISGGNESVKYFVSGNYQKQDGLYASGALGFEQYQIRSNTDIKLHEKVKLGVDVFGSRANRDEPGVNAAHIHKHLQVTLPTEVGIYPNGLFGFAAENGNNPRVMASNASGFRDQQNSELRTQFTADIDLDWILKGLSIRGKSTFTQRNVDTKLFNNTWTVYDYDQTNDEYIPLNGFNFNTGNFLSVEDTYFKFNENYHNAQLSYNKTLGDHSIKSFVAFEQLTGTWEQFSAYKRDLISAEHPSLFAGSDDGQRSNGESTEWGRLNYFGSVAYDFKKKYLIDFTLRHDGSGNFAEGNRFGTFPSISAGWVISEEAFMKGIAGNWLDFLKIRASWAKMGNDRVPAFQYLTRYNYGGGNARNRNYYIFGENPVQVNTFFNSNVPNPDITWEQAYAKNIGLNFAMFNDKISGNVNYFHQTRTDILVRRNASVPDYTALELPQENIGEVNSYGFEAELSYNNTGKVLGYSFGGNFTLAKNKVIYLDEAQDVPEWRKREGYPMNSYLIYPSDGIFRDQAEVDATEAKLPGTLPGDVKYVDTDGDGEITGNDVIRKYTSPIPEIQFGVFGRFTYKGFELNTLFQGQARAEVEVRFDNEGNRPLFLYEGRWTPENTEARFPRALQLGDTYNSRLSDIWLQDASFIRLKELELAYNFPASLIKFAEVRVFARGTNLITFDKLKDLKGFDPEMSRYYNFSAGLYQPLKSLSLGANIQF